ncbi:MAG: GatB/YqeY domain-containing protein [Patescibacteria group bacterium]|nr:GatB/YqeY domain-containing protein [Patescibacteria group bacterium]
MLSLSQIETDLVAAIKSKQQALVETLRGLKTRIQNEQIAKMKELAEADIVALVKSEVKRRKEAAETYVTGGRAELAEKELMEAGFLEKYLPPQMSESQIAEMAEKLIAEKGFTAADFGKAMGQLKAQAGQNADGSLLAKVLKEQLK